MLKSSCILILNLLVFVIFRNELALKQMATIFLVIGRAKRAPHWGVQSRFRVIYIYMSVCMSVVCQITWNHVNQTRACSKSVLGGKIRPVTPVLFVSTIR